jgi:hypothetical protein
MNASELLERMRAEGLDVVIEGSHLFLQGPQDRIARWCTAAKAVKAELWALVRGPDRLGCLRQFCPQLWTPVRVKGVGVGRLWGVHARGVVVHVLETNVLLTLDPNEVEVIDKEDGERMNETS